MNVKQLVHVAYIEKCFNIRTIARRVCYRTLEL